MKSNDHQKRPFDHLLKQHPCFNEEAHFKHGRIHLPVSPDCNIQCRFCKRGFNKWEDRPGVSRGLLTPQEAVAKVGQALQLCPELTVVGIAGPGDTLATDHALEVFEQVHQSYPQLINCLSTNGLLLAEKAERIVAAGVKTVTVTINSLNEQVLPRICAAVTEHGRYQEGQKAVRRLILAQLDGVKKIVALGVTVKINTVLIPGVNDHCIGEIALATAGLGAARMNIIPLIPTHEYQNWQAPDCKALNDAREAAERFLPVFRHCQHCRADAFGIPGASGDLRDQLYDQPLATTFSHG